MDPVYRVEYSVSGRAACKGRQPCNGTIIRKGELRFGVVVDFNGHDSFQWRHWGCVTSRQFTNICRAYAAAEHIPGFETLDDVDKQRVITAFNYRSVDPNDIPDSALEGEQTSRAAAQDRQYAAINAAEMQAASSASPSKAPVYDPNAPIYDPVDSSPVKREDIKPVVRKPKAPAKARVKKESVKAELNDLADPFAAGVDPSPTLYGGGGRRSTRLVARALARTEEDVKPSLFESSEAEDDEDVKPVVKKAAPKGKGKPRAKKVKAEDVDFRDGQSD